MSILYSIPIYLFFGLQLAMLPREMISYYERRTDSLRLRIVFHTGLHLLFNSIWLLSLSDFARDFMLDRALLIVGSITASYTFYFWQTEFQLKNRVRKSVLLFVQLILLSLIYILIERIGVSQYYWMYIALYATVQLSTLYFVIGFFVSISKTNEQPTVLGKAIIFACGLSCFVPLFAFFSNYFLLNYSYLNCIFFSVSLAYTLYAIKQSNLESMENQELFQIIASQELESQHIALENELKSKTIVELKNYIERLEKKEQSEDHVTEVLMRFDTLTASEFEVAKLLALGYSFQEISEQKHIAPSTVRKHASTIYSKLEVKNLEEYRKSFL